MSGASNLGLVALPSGCHPTPTCSLIDGFPRALDQASVFESSIGLPKAVLFFECPEDEMEKRLLKRGETSGRADDNAETIRKRFKASAARRCSHGALVLNGLLLCTADLC